ncbi:MAG: hypothetical protein DRJ43_00915 [Thermoprotei archaeon]|nr:MAG: hypothetical protein DRJ43_00915 [Thermoprotei archaeon]
MPAPGDRLSLPPRIKVLEALGSIADGRVRKVGENIARVTSSTGDRKYLVYVDPEKRVAYSDDNGTKYRGYIGYPIIAMLMIEGALPYDERIAKALAGIPWKKLNERFKRYAIVERIVKREALRRGVKPREIDSFIRKVMDKLSTLNLRYSEPPPPPL